MRVAVNGWFWDLPETGSGQYVQRLVGALAQSYPTLHLDVLVPSSASGNTASSEGPANVRIISHAVPRTNLRKVWWEQVQVPRLALNREADLLHIPYWAPPAHSPLPVVVTIHDIIPLVLPAYRGDARVRLYTALVRAATSAATLVLTDSRASEDDVTRHLGLPHERVRAVPLAVGPEYTPDATATDRAIRAELGLPETYVLYLGGFDVRKNLRTVMAAFAIVHRACPGARLAIGGRLPIHDTSFTPDPRRLAREAGLFEGSVHFLGFVAEDSKPALYRGARALIFPSTYEGFGYPPLEAISCGTPVVGGDVSSLPEVVGDAGVLLPPEDAEGMAGVLIQLLCDPAFYEEMRAHAIDQSHSFSWVRTADETLAAFRAVLSRTEVPQKEDYGIIN